MKSKFYLHRPKGTWSSLNNGQGNIRQASGSGSFLEVVISRINANHNLIHERMHQILRRPHQDLQSACFRFSLKELACITVHCSSFHVHARRISANLGKQNSTNTDYMRQNGTARQMNDPFLVKFMWHTLVSAVFL